jgi:ABC-type multidrug transport system fused ATPase/permease subunit
MDGTIGENIVFGRSLEQTNPIRINQAIDQAQLRDFVDSLPQRERTIVGERGIRLSGGEQQRVALARSLYSNPDVLIFDEATSALDSATEGSLMKTIRDIARDRTVIMVAHRWSTLKDCDRIVVMNNGRIEKIVGYKELIG